MSSSSSSSSIEEEEEEEEISNTLHFQFMVDDDEDDNDKEEEEEEEEEGNISSSVDDTPHVCKAMYGSCRSCSRSSGWFLGAKWIRVFPLISVTGLFIDPLFFYALTISESCMCLFVDGWFAITITVFRCINDVLHVWNMWLQFKMSKKVKKGFLFDLFVILPLPQVVLWLVTPSLLHKGWTEMVMTVFLIIFLFQYVPKTYNSVRLLLRVHHFSSYVFSTVWWGFTLNMIAYFIASHAAGGSWYLLGTQRVVKCLTEQCRVTEGCGLRTIVCEMPIYYGEKMLKDVARLGWAANPNVRSVCVQNAEHNYDYYGLYAWSVQVIVNDNRMEKILYPIFWGLTTLSSFGNLQSTTEWLETVFNSVIITSGLILVTMLIGNIKLVFLNGTTTKKQAMNLKMRSIEWWMKQRNLPEGFRRRVRQYEWQRWAATRGVDESEMTRNLPEGLRRDIKYHLCLDLVRQVPLFQHMEDVVLKNICDRVKSLIFPNGETIVREGDPVLQMIFVVRGHLRSSQVLRDGVESCCMLGPGNFTGDELLSWCLRRPFLERLPPSSSTLVSLETTEAFGLEASDLKYVTQHFRYTFVNEKVKRSARYYSPGWRTWGAVAIQLAWRRYKHRLTLASLSFLRPRCPMSRTSSREEDRIRLYTALLTSPKPDQDDPCN